MQSSWDEIIDQHASMIVAAALRVTGNTADAEDVAQDVFCEVLAKWQHQPDLCSGGLLRTIAVRRALDLVRRRRSRMLEDAELRCPSAETVVERTMMEAELDRKLRDQLAKLAPREAEVFCLRYYEQVAVAEIARQLGTSPSAVSKALSVARRKIQQGLRPYFAGESK